MGISRLTPILTGLFFIFVISFLKLPSASAYPNFIGYGYGNCTACHFNPLGGGALTDYGRGVMASVISAKPFLYKVRDDEALIEQSSFTFGKAKLPDWLRLNGSFRGLYLTRPAPAENKLYIMQLDGTVVLKGFDDRLVVVGTVGYLPYYGPPIAAGQEEPANMISRDHYIGYRFYDSMFIAGGKMDIAYGTRVPDHTAYSRKNTNLAQNDQTYGVLVHGTPDDGKWDLAGHLLLGNLADESNVRQTGFSLRAEREILDKFRVGASFLNTSSDFRSMRLMGVHAAIGLGPGSSILLETGLISNKPSTQTDSINQMYAFMQHTLNLFRGWNLLNTFELYSSDFSSDAVPTVYRATPGLQIFLMPRVELRQEFQWQRTHSPSTLVDDQFFMLTQLHLYL
jgi:hypothetical protein